MLQFACGPESVEQLIDLTGHRQDLIRRSRLATLESFTENGFDEFQLLLDDLHDLLVYRGNPRDLGDQVIGEHPVGGGPDTG